MLKQSVTEEKLNKRKNALPEKNYVRENSIACITVINILENPIDTLINNINQNKLFSPLTTWEHSFILTGLAYTFPLVFLIYYPAPLPHNLSILFIYLLTSNLLYVLAEHVTTSEPFGQEIKAYLRNIGYALKHAGLSHNEIKLALLKYTL